MIRIKLGTVVGVAMLIAALSSAAPVNSYPKCLSDNGSTCTGCFLDESTRVSQPPPATGGQIEVVIMDENGPKLNFCVNDASKTFNTCSNDQQSVCPGSRYLVVYGAAGQECNLGPPNTATYIDSNGLTYTTCQP